MTYNKPSQAARTAAVARLIAEHTDEFSGLLAEERTNRGLPAQPRSRYAGPTVPMPDLARRVRPEVFRAALGINGVTWSRWLKSGRVPEGLVDEIAAAVGVPAALLWPDTPKPAPKPAPAAPPPNRHGETLSTVGAKAPQPARQSTPPARAEYRCTCGETFDTRGGIARQRAFCEDAA